MKEIKLPKTKNKKQASKSQSDDNRQAGSIALDDVSTRSDNTQNPAPPLRNVDPLKKASSKPTSSAPLKSSFGTKKGFSRRQDSQSGMPSQNSSTRNFGAPPMNSGMPMGQPGGFSGGFGGDPWSGGNSWGDPWGNSSGNNQKKKLTPQERTEMIEKVYQQVLGRKADTRDINYYKYSSLGEEEIIKQLLDGKEHKQVINDGRDYKSMTSRAEKAETRVKVLESQIQDQLKEFKELTNLLREKNQHIQRLRLESDNPYDFVHNNQRIKLQKSGEGHYMKSDERTSQNQIVSAEDVSENPYLAVEPNPQETEVSSTVFSAPPGQAISRGLQPPVQKEMTTIERLIEKIKEFISV